MKYTAEHAKSNPMKLFTACCSQIVSEQVLAMQISKLKSKSACPAAHSHEHTDPSALPEQTPNKVRINMMQDFPGADDDFILLFKGEL